MYREAAFDGTDLRPRQRLPVAVELGETSLMMLVHPTLTGEEMDRAVAAVAEVCADAQAGSSAASRSVA